MKNTKIQLAVGILISAFFLYIVLRPVNKADLWQSIYTFNWWWAPPYIGLTFLSMYVRAIRWHFLMKPQGNFSAARLFSPMMAGFGVNSVLPGRAGEFARAYVLGAREKLPFTGVFATIVVERIFDSLTLLILMLIVFASLKIDPDLTMSYGGFKITGAMLISLTHNLVLICVVMLVVSFVLMWRRGRQFVQFCVERLPLLPHRFRMKISAMIGHFTVGLSSLRDLRSWIIISVLSFVVWVIIGYSTAMLAYGFPPMHISLAQGIAITVISAIAILIPAAPGYWGLQHLGIMFALLLLGVEKDQARALGYAFMAHGLQYFPIGAAGLFCLWHEHVSISEIAHIKDDQRT